MKGIVSVPSARENKAHINGRVFYGFCSLLVLGCLFR